MRPEILVVVDQKLYNKLGNNVASVNNYVRNFWNAVNLRYKSITSPRIELNIAGIIIGKTPGDTPYLKQSKVSGDTFEAAKALDLMGKYFYKTETVFPVFDLVVTMTNLDMCSRDNGQCRKTTAGYAYVGGACVVKRGWARSTAWPSWRTVAVTQASLSLLMRWLICWELSMTETPAPGGAPGHRDTS